jgi:hypothetical protein
MGSAPHHGGGRASSGPRARSYGFTGATVWAAWMKP